MAPNAAPPETESSASGDRQGHSSSTSENRRRHPHTASSFRSALGGTACDHSLATVVNPAICDAPSRTLALTAAVQGVRRGDTGRHCPDTDLFSDPDTKFVSPRREQQRRCSAARLTDCLRAALKANALSPENR